MKNLKKTTLIFTILSFLTLFTSANAEIKVVASIKPIHSLASYLMNGVGKPSLIVEKGKIVTLIGPNGSGKSTTAKIALGIYKKIEGQVEKYTNNVGYVPQKISIDWTLPLRVNDFMLLTENLKDEAVNEALS